MEISKQKIEKHQEDIVSSGEVKNEDCRDIYPIFHAIHLKDYKNYINNNGIVCRKILMETKNYTSFESDKMDEEKGLLSRTFANLFDHNSFFWEMNPHKFYPCVYGPITIKLKDSTWDILEDPVFSCGTMGSTCEPRKLSISDVKTAIRDRKVSKIECNFKNEIIPMKYFEEVIVDPIVILEKRLIDAVRNKTPKDINIRLRKGHKDAQLIFEGIIKALDVGKKVDGKSKKIQHAFDNWVKYFLDGTIGILCDNGDE